MPSLDQFKNESPIHKVKVLSNGAFSIEPVSSSLEDIQQFQLAAEDAIAAAHAEGRHYVPHQTSRYPGDLYEKIVFSEA